MSIEALTETQMWWLHTLAAGNDPRRKRRPATANYEELTTTLMALRRHELIDKDGRITNAGKQYVRAARKS